MVMMRVEYSLSFETLSELHVGSGRSEQRKQHKQDEPQGECALFIVDNSGAAWIPGTTLKGAFLENCGDLGERLFGRAHRKNTTLAQGELTFSGLQCKTSGLVTEKVRTSVDHGTGASAARKLFSQMFVDRGARFEGDLVLQCDLDRLAAAKAEVLACLQRFARDEGVSIGAGKADGLGRLRLMQTVTLTESRLGKEGWSIDHQEQLMVTPEADETWDVFNLVCDGPYMVRGEVIEEGADDKKHQVTYAERFGEAPRLFPTGVAGALRARAQWLAELRALQMGTTLADTQEMVETSAGKVPLDVVQRLFGYEGYRALLVMKAERDSAKQHVQSRHPAGPLDPVLQLPKTVPTEHGKKPKGALHKRNADSQVGLRLSLRMWRKTAQADELALFEALKSDLKANGLALGLGTAKGFGWFGMAPTEPSTQKPSRPMNSELTLERKHKLPAPEITLPYRQIEVDPEKVGMPEEAVVNAHAERSLWSKPLADGLSGWVDVSWCFETAMLVGDTAAAGPYLRFRDGKAVPNGKDVRSPQFLGNDPVIPGTTLRGAIRSLIEIATASRLGDSRMNPYLLDDGGNRKDWPFKSVAEEWRRLPLHSPPYDENYVPDFTEALLGFISPDGGRLSPDLHSRLHLKSRISFGWARLIGGRDRSAENIVHRAVLLSPRAGSVFMDHVSRRVYPATMATTQSILEALAESAQNAKDEKTVSWLRFLQPKGDQPLVFRGRIRFHNVTEVELGALMWAITLGMGPGMRHMIGSARPFGAGRCYAADLRMKVARHDGGKVVEADSEAAEAFGPNGGLAQTFVEKFEEWIDRNGLRTQGLQERLAAADPAYGAALARRAAATAEYVAATAERVAKKAGKLNRLSGKPRKTVRYQTHQMLKDNHADDPTGFRKPVDIALANGGGPSGAGRLAAMMKR